MKKDISDEDFEKIKHGVELIAETLEVNQFELNTGLQATKEFLCRVAAVQLSEQDQRRLLNRMKVRIEELNKQKPPQ